MKHRLTLVLVAAAVGCAALVAGAAAAHGHGGKGQLFTFSGALLSDPGPNASTVSVQVETGNKPALRALIGSSQNQVFSLGSGTEVLLWSNGVPHVGSTGDLRSGDYVTLRIRAPYGSSMQEIESNQAGIVADRAAPNAKLPLWLFEGTVAGPQSGGKVNLHVDSGNWKALRAMLGQSLDQSFSYDDRTIFLLWHGKVPTVIDSSELKAGDRITVRIRAPLGASLAQIEATPARHVGDHEPAAAPGE